MIEQEQHVDDERPLVNEQEQLDSFSDLADFYDIDERPLVNEQE